MRNPRDKVVMETTYNNYQVKAIYQVGLVNKAVIHLELHLHETKRNRFLDMETSFLDDVSLAPRICQTLIFT